MTADGALRAGLEHELKCWPEYFAALLDGTKTFEYRYADRGFAVGDVLWLREYQPPDDDSDGHYTGRELRRRVTYLLPVYEGRYVVMAVADLLAFQKPSNTPLPTPIPAWYSKNSNAV